MVDPSYAPMPTAGSVVLPAVYGSTVASAQVLCPLASYAYGPVTVR